MAELTLKPMPSESQPGSLLPARLQTTHNVSSMLCSEAETSEASWAAEALPKVQWSSILDKMDPLKPKPSR